MNAAERYEPAPRYRDCADGGRELGQDIRGDVRGRAGLPRRSDGPERLVFRGGFGDDGGYVVEAGQPFAQGFRVGGEVAEGEGRRRVFLERASEALRRVAGPDDYHGFVHGGDFRRTSVRISFWIIKAAATARKGNIGGGNISLVGRRALLYYGALGADGRVYFSRESATWNI
jgi:hypothetical protein